MTNPFGCPDSVYYAMQVSPAPELLRAVLFLGPNRVQWNPDPIVGKAQIGDGKSPVHWRFARRSDHATYGEIIDAARKAGCSLKVAA